MEYIDFSRRGRSDRIGLIFPGWKKGESVGFLSPHDDDALLGAGCLILATLEAGGIPHIFVFCRGDAGYSTPEEKRGIVGRRQREAVRAYGLLGVRPESIHHFGLPDFSLMSRLDRNLPSGKGVFEKIIRAVRKERISRLAFSSGYFEHWDHTAVFYAGIYTSPQAQDPILVDWGKPFAIRTYLVYSVWGDFEPSPRSEKIRADFGILAGDSEEKTIVAAIRRFSSQARIIETIVAQRDRRKSAAGYLELYQSFKVRRTIDYAPYFKLLKKKETS